MNNMRPEIIRITTPPASQAPVTLAERIAKLRLEHDHRERLFNQLNGQNTPRAVGAARGLADAQRRLIEAQQAQIEELMAKDGEHETREAELSEARAKIGEYKRIFSSKTSLEAHCRGRLKVRRQKQLALIAEQKAEISRLEEEARQTEEGGWRFLATLGFEAHEYE